ncbi:hypothetical protein C8Q79DRAFT_655144 [Trametes meyenii]|nr:hypothetical protein C8Q79DRAFT_655144 [Trametes meyenii]
MHDHLWTPTKPGQHGFMQVSFGKEKHPFERDEHRHVFMGAGRWFMYCGFYHITRVESFSAAEWDVLPVPLKVAYVETTVDKDQGQCPKPVTAEAVFANYERGRLHVPCVQMRCVKFDMKFYEELVRENCEWFGHSPSPTPPELDSVSGRRKRQRIESDTEYSDG